MSEQKNGTRPTQTHRQRPDARSGRGNHQTRSPSSQPGPQSEGVAPKQTSAGPDQTSVLSRGCTTYVSQLRCPRAAPGAVIQRDRHRLGLVSGAPADISHRVPCFSALRRSVLINREDTPPSSSRPSTTSGSSSGDSWIRVSPHFSSIGSRDTALISRVTPRAFADRHFGRRPLRRWG